MPDLASRDLLARHPELAPNDVPAELVTWRYGFIHRANLPSSAVPSVIEHEAGRFLHGLVIHRFQGLDDALAVVATRPRALRELEITGRTPPGVEIDFDDAMNDRRPSPDFPAVWPSLARLTQLRIATSLDVDFSGIDMPNLAALALNIDSNSPEVSLEQIARAPWPALERFEFHTSRSPARQRSLPALRTLLMRTDLPKLAHIGMRGMGFPQDPELFDGSRVLGKLRSLDLSRNLLTDEDARILGSCALRLERLDVSRNGLTTDGLRALAPIATTLVADDQYEPDGGAIDGLYDY